MSHAAAPDARDALLETCGALHPALAERLWFLAEIDRLRTVQRRTTLADGSRRENSAEHSWHLAMMALVLAEHADEDVDLPHVIELVLCHDIVEIDADDTFVYDAAGMATKRRREERAADRLYGLLPDAQGARLRGLWEEYEARSTPEARFAYALDRLQPILLNFLSGGGSWGEHGVTGAQVREANATAAEGSAALWAVIEAIVDEAEDRGWL